MKESLGQVLIGGETPICREGRYSRYRLLTLTTHRSRLPLNA